MAKNAALVGWGVAGLLCLILIGKCAGDSPTTSSSIAATTPARPVVQKTLYVSAASLNCRTAGSSSATRVEVLSEGMSVGVIEEADGWSKLDRTTPCWVSSSYLAITPRAAQPQRFASTGGSSRSSGYSSSGSTRRSSGSSSTRRSAYSNPDAGTCPCRGNHVCIGPRGGRYCITSGGNKRYGV